MITGHHQGCYLLILLVTRISIEPTLFHDGCRPSLQVGLLLLQHLYLTMGGTHPINHVRKAQHLYLTMGGTHPINHVRKSHHLYLTMGRTHPINHVRKEQHLYLTMGGTHPVKPVRKEHNPKMSVSPRLNQIPGN